MKPLKLDANFCVRLNGARSELNVVKKRNEETSLCTHSHYTLEHAFRNHELVLMPKRKIIFKSCFLLKSLICTSVSVQTELCVNLCIIRSCPLEGGVLNTVKHGNLRIYFTLKLLCVNITLKSRSESPLQYFYANRHAPTPQPISQHLIQMAYFRLFLET